MALYTSREDRDPGHGVEYGDPSIYHRVGLAFRRFPMENKLLEGSRSTSGPMRAEQDVFGRKGAVALGPPQLMKVPAEGTIRNIFFAISLRGRYERFPTTEEIPHRRRWDGLEQ